VAPVPRAISQPACRILLVASALSAAAGDATSFLIVVTIIALSTTLDFLQEFRAHNAVDALRRSVAVRAMFGAMAR
jgi:Mg2+-importing ATPase